MPTIARMTTIATAVSWRVVSDFAVAFAVARDPVLGASGAFVPTFGVVAFPAFAGAVFAVASFAVASFAGSGSSATLRGLTSRFSLAASPSRYAFSAVRHPCFDPT